MLCADSGLFRMTKGMDADADAEMILILKQVQNDKGMTEE